MENHDPSHNNPNNINRSRLSRGSMSDTDSQTSQIDSFHSPLRSPLRSDEPFPPHEKSPVRSPSKAIVAVDKCYAPAALSPPQNHQKQPESYDFPADGKSSATLMFNRSAREDPASGVAKVGPDGEGVEGHGRRTEVGGERRSRKPAASSILRRSTADVTLKRAALGFRVCEMVLCLISFSVMAADKTQGWTGDSFDRYKEYRYCLAMTVIGFAYSGLQAFDLSYHLITGKYVISHHLRYHFDFLMDQIIAYLLISASSSAAARVDDWVSNWGKDAFTEMASASVGMAFLAFAAFAFSALLSGYNLCNWYST